MPDAVRLHTCEMLRAKRLIRIADDVIDVCGGIAGRTRGTFWANCAIGLGLTGPVPAETMTELCAWFQEIGSRPLLEMCDHADASLIKSAAIAGMRLRRMIAVMSRPLCAQDADWSPSAEIAVERISASDEQRMAEIAAVVGGSFATPERPVRQVDLDANIKGMRDAVMITFRAAINGRTIGGAFLDVTGELASLFGGAVDAACRGRGVQTALLRARLSEAARLGATTAMLEAVPGGPTHRNASRLGFTLCYNRAVLTTGLED